MCRNHSKREQLWQHNNNTTVCRCRVCRSKQREHTQLPLQLLAGPPLRPAQPIPTHAPQQGRPSWCHRRSVPHRLLPRRQLAWAQRRLRAPIRTNRWRRCAFAPRTPHGSTPRSCKEALPTASDEGTDHAGRAGLRIPQEMARVATHYTTRAWHARPRGTALPVQARALVDGIQAARLCRVDAEGAAIAGRQAAALADSDPRVVQLQVCPDECVRLCAARDPVSRSPLSSAQQSNAKQSNATQRNATQLIIKATQSARPLGSLRRRGRCRGSGSGASKPSAVRQQCSWRLGLGVGVALALPPLHERRMQPLVMHRRPWAARLTRSREICTVRPITSWRRSCRSGRSTVSVRNRSALPQA